MPKGISMTNHHIIKCNGLKVVLILFILGFVLTGGAAATEQQNQDADASKSCLWSIQTGVHTISLLGSFHLLKSDVYPLAAAIDEAYSSSQKVIFEADVNAMQTPTVLQKIQRLGLFPEGQTLNQQISADTYTKLKTKMSELGLPMQQFALYKPWLIALTLELSELLRLGYDPSYGIDMHFLNRAKQDAKELDYLESIEYQFDLLGNMNQMDQESLLRHTLEDLDDIENMATDMIAYWKSGDAENLYQLLNKNFDKHPRIRDSLLIQRNRAWAARIEALLKENQNVLVIVGAGHLVGPDSVVDLLKKKGYRVKQK
jgi:hypothetical protein